MPDRSPQPGGVVDVPPQPGPTTSEAISELTFAWNEYDLEVDERLSPVAIFLKRMLRLIVDHREHELYNYINDLEAVVRQARAIWLRKEWNYFDEHWDEAVLKVLNSRSSVGSTAGSSRTPEGERAQTTPSPGPPSEDTNGRDNPASSGSSRRDMGDGSGLTTPPSPHASFSPVVDEEIEAMVREREKAAADRKCSISGCGVPFNEHYFEWDYWHPHEPRP